MLKLSKRTSWRNKTPGNIWWIVGTINGRRVRESTQTTDRTLAEALLLKRERELVGNALFGESSSLTFEEAASLYVQSGGEKRFVSKLVEILGSKQVRDLTARDLLSTCAHLYPDAKPATKARNVCGPVNAVIRRCHDEGLCDLKVFKKPKIEKQPIEAAPDSWLHSFALTAPPRLGALCLFISFTGPRIGEACRLRWSDVDLESCRAIIPMTKNGKSRAVPLAPIVVGALAELSSDLLEDDGLVFGYSQRWLVTNAIKRHCKRANIKYYSTHSIGRHAFATRLLNQGHSLITVKEAGGWKSASMVTDHYGHLEQSLINQVVIEADREFRRYSMRDVE